MMKKYRLLSLALAVLMCISLLPCVAGAEEPISKTVNANIAQNKYVYSNGGNAGTKAQLLTDGRRNTDYTILVGDNVLYMNESANDLSGVLPSGKKIDAASTSVMEWYMIDLGRKYKLTGAKVYSSTIPGTASPAVRYMSNIEIQASNTEDFTTYKTILKITNATVDNFPVTESVCDEPGYYRYVRLMKTARSEHGLSEIEIFADVPLTEVSRGKEVTASVSSYETLPSVTTDGLVSGSWLVESVAGAKYLSVDLGEELPVSWIEMVARVTDTDNPSTRDEWEIYASTDAPTLETAQSGTKLLPKLFAGYNGNYNILFPKQSEGYLSMPIYSGAQEDTYRYITFYKTINNTALSEVRAFVTNPEVIKSEVKDSALYLEFSEEMASPENYISVYNVTDNKDVSAALNDTLEDGRIKVSTPGLFGKDIKVTVEKEVTNTKGVSLSVPFIEMYKTPSALVVSGYSAEDIKLLDAEGEETVLASAKKAEMKLTLSNLSDTPISVMLILAAFDADGNLLACTEDSTEVGESGAELPLSLTLSGLSGVNSVSAFLLDNYGTLKAWSPSVTKN